jgi:hypothetical protein
MCITVISCGGPGSSVGIATELPGWTVRDRIPVGMRFFAHPASCKMGTGSFPGVSTAGACC